jgi:hypothetical protein
MGKEQQRPPLLGRPMALATLADTVDVLAMLNVATLRPHDYLLRSRTSQHRGVCGRSRYAIESSPAM